MIGSLLNTTVITSLLNGNIKKLKNWQIINELRGKVKHKKQPSFKMYG